MPNFERVKRLSNILFGVSGVLIFLLILNLSSYTSEGIFSSTYFIVLLFSFTLAITLRCVAKDVKEFIDKIVKLNK